MSSIQQNKVDGTHRSCIHGVHFPPIHHIFTCIIMRTCTYMVAALENKFGKRQVSTPWRGRGGLRLTTKCKQGKHVQERLKQWVAEVPMDQETVGETGSWEVRVFDTTVGACTLYGALFQDNVYRKLSIYLVRFHVLSFYQFLISTVLNCQLFFITFI